MQKNKEKGRIQFLNRRCLLPKKINLFIRRNCNIKYPKHEITYYVNHEHRRQEEINYLEKTVLMKITILRHPILLVDMK